VIPKEIHSDYKTSQETLVVPGTVLAFQPGKVYLQDDLRDPSVLESLLPDPNFMLTSRYDGVLIDSRTASEMPSNHYALAHFINHCGADRRPNVMAVSGTPTDSLPNYLSMFFPISLDRLRLAGRSPLWEVQFSFGIDQVYPK
jgi:hypothetical protein